MNNNKKNSKQKVNKSNKQTNDQNGGRGDYRGRDRMIVGFTTTCAISAAYLH
jgi:hypothetical protein